MPIVKKRKLSARYPAGRSKRKSPDNFFLALDNIPLFVTYSKIEAFFHPVRLSGIRMNCNYGVLRAPQVELDSMSSKDLVIEKFQGKVFEGQILFLRSPEDMQATKAGCGWEMVHPILQRELFSHFSIYSRLRLQRVSKSWQHNLDTLDPRVNETVCYPNEMNCRDVHIFPGAGFNSSDHVFPTQAKNSVRHLIFSEDYAGTARQLRDFEKHHLVKMFPDCQKVTFVKGEYTEKWIDEALQAFYRVIPVQFVNCRIRLRFSYLVKGTVTRYLRMAHNCKLELRSLTVNARRNMDSARALNAFYQGLQNECPAWLLAAWNDWWVQQKSSLSSDLLTIIQAYFESDRVRGFLVLSETSKDGLVKKDAQLNIRDCIFLRNFFAAKKVALPPALETLFPSIVFDLQDFRYDPADPESYEQMSDDCEQSDDEYDDDDDNEDDDDDDEEDPYNEDMLANFFAGGNIYGDTEDEDEDEEDDDDDDADDNQVDEGEEQDKASVESFEC